MTIVTEENLFKSVECAFLGKIANPGDDKMQVHTMTIHPNSTKKDIPFHSMMTNNGLKDVRPVYSKRKLLVNEDPEITSMQQMKLVRLVPFGYTGEEMNI